MSPLDRALHAYFDGELGRLARVRFEARLRRSPELRQQLEVLRVIRARTREAQPSSTPPDVWNDISRRLVSIDAELEDERSERPAWSRWVSAPGALGSTALAAAAAVVAVLVLSPGPGDQIIPSGVQTAGVIRYLDTGERSVMLVDDREDVTIIWMMDPEGGEA